MFSKSISIKEKDDKNEIFRMNICFFQGKILSDINFNFVIENCKCLSNKHTSICYFRILLDNESCIRVNAYDEMADVCYRNLRTGDYISICGRLCKNYEVELYEIKINK